MSHDPGAEDRHATSSMWEVVKRNVETTLKVIARGLIIPAAGAHRMYYVKQ